MEEDFVILVLIAEWGGHFYVNGQIDGPVLDEKRFELVFDQISDNLKSYKRSKWMQNELKEYSARIKWSKDWMYMKIGPITVFPMKKDDALITCRIGSINLEKTDRLHYIVNDLKSFMTQFPALQSE